MIIYSSSITARLRYTADFIGAALMDQPFQLTDKKDEWLSYEGPKINYSPEPITDKEFWQPPHGLLFEKGIKKQSTECFKDIDQKYFFKTGGDHSFDIFAATFYLLSRYEEYLPHAKDIYGRYAHENSLAFKEGFLDKPLINGWLAQFKEKLVRKFPGLSTSDSPFRFLPTYDIDEAYCYKYKAQLRSFGGAIKDLLSGEWKNYKVRNAVLENKINDPFDSYEWIDQLHKNYKIAPRFFFLVPDKTSKYDKNILPTEPAMQSLIKQHAEKYEIGVHPSWQSGDEPALVKNEILSIENITKKKVLFSRQHFIRFNLPDTFRQLIEWGIKEDFSMGYGSINGFRASVASTFYWYDLEKEEQTGLLLYPFCYMEANSFYEQRMTSWEALKEMTHYYQEVKKVNGTLITIWHNTFLGTAEKFKGWREVYESFFKEVAGEKRTVD